MGPDRDSGVLDRRAIFGIGLFAESNSLVLSALAFGAVSIAFAIFLILELGLPYTGLMRVSPAALEQTIELVDK